MSNYLHRLAEKEFAAAADSMRIVLVSGARQCGKTTLLKQMLKEEDLFLSFDDAMIREAASSDPVAFLRPYLKQYRRIAIDEVQKVPEILGSMKLIVDEESLAGRFLISGSSNYQALPGVNESLAGRLAEVRLRTMTASELSSNINADLIDSFAKGEWGRLLYKVEECSKEVVLNKALIGGYPEVSSKTPQARKIWFENYITRLLERDLKDIGHFEKGDALRKILLLLSNISSRTISRQELSKALMLHSATIDRYLGALKTMYLIDEVPAWSNKIMPRLVKAPNFYMSDSGLMSALQGHYDLDSLMRCVNYVGKPGSDFIGNLVETWVFNQLVPIATASGNWSIFHLRVSQRQEIDFVLQNELGQQLLVEVKASETVTKEDFKHIDWYFENNPESTLRGIVLYCGQAVRNFGEKYTAVPMAKLWRAD